MLGEDSGIEVAALDWGPGIFSARFGGDDPVGRLLAELSGIEGEGRRARYVCELIAISDQGDELRGSGTLYGRIGHEPRGSEGFGYDPIFIPEGETATVAELGNAWKQRQLAPGQGGAGTARGARGEVALSWPSRLSSRSSASAPAPLSPSPPGAPPPTS